MKVSVIVIHYNTPELLKNCLDSFYESNKAVSFDVIVVDNASSNKFNKDRLMEDYSNISFIENSENVGFAKANNQGAVEALGEYLFLLNSDTVTNKDVLSPLVSFYESKKKIGILGPRLLNQDRSIQYYGSVLGRHKYRGNNPRVVDFLSGAAMFVNKELYLAVGGFDENYFFYNEDLDLCKTLTRKGYQNYYHPEIVLVHLGGGSTFAAKSLKKQAWKSSWYFFKKFYLSFLRPLNQ
ncbi:MAG: glycosyltransferase family 2 protein [Candidatus Margulisbacteria bacterium]|nr:glycosyltransferase family 2 protein [Candidatus Margulisiibacteriota bacterium]